MQAFNDYLQLLQNGAYAAIACLVLTGINTILLITVLGSQPSAGSIAKRVNKMLWGPRKDDGS